MLDVPGLALVFWNKDWGEARTFEGLLTVFDKIKIISEENLRRIGMFLIFPFKNWEDLRRLCKQLTFLRWEKLMLFSLIRINPVTELPWVTLHIIKIKTKKFMQQNVIYVISSINKANNNKDLWYMQIMVTFILSVVIQNVIKYLSNRSSIKFWVQQKA